MAVYRTNNEDIFFNNSDLDENNVLVLLNERIGTFSVADSNGKMVLLDIKAIGNDVWIYFHDFDLGEANWRIVFFKVSLGFQGDVGIPSFLSENGLTELLLLYGDRTKGLYVQNAQSSKIYLAESDELTGLDEGLPDPLLTDFIVSGVHQYDNNQRMMNVIIPFAGTNNKWFAIELVLGALKYQFQIANSSRFTSTIYNSVQDTEMFSIPNNSLLTHGVQYYWRVRISKIFTSNVYAWRNWSAPMTFIVNTPPEAPTGLEVRKRI